MIDRKGAALSWSFAAHEAKHEAHKKPFLVVLNKIDLVSYRNWEDIIALTPTNLGLEPKQVIPVDAKSDKHLSG